MTCGVREWVVVYNVLVQCSGWGGGWYSVVEWCGGVVGMLRGGAGWGVEIWCG